MTACRLCEVCGTADRYISGHCKHCAKANKLRLRASQPPRVDAHSRILAALPGDYKQIAAKTGLSIATVRKYLGTLHTRKEVHITAMQPAATQGRPCPVWAAGATADASSDAYPTTFRRLVPPRSADGILPAALMGQRRAFALAGVWV